MILGLAEMLQRITSDFVRIESEGLARRRVYLEWPLETGPLLSSGEEASYAH